ncbi:MAG TPA: nitroreductase family deazaflavin-dependent oxidoreductase [Dermatophilaceae bacterium]
MSSPVPAGQRTYRAAAPWQQAIRRLSALRPVSRVMALALPYLDPAVSGLTRGRHTLTGIMTGLTVAELTTTGSVSGRPRKVRLLGFPMEDGFVVIASNFGRTRHPAWYHNLLTQPQAELAVHGRSQRVVAELTTGRRRAQLWKRALTFFPGWREYQGRQESREIGVFLLSAQTDPAADSRHQPRPGPG